MKARRTDKKTNRAGDKKTGLAETVIVTLLLGAGAVIHPVQAQNPRVISLNKAIQTAIDSNLTVKSASYAVDVQKALKGSAIDLPKTSFAGEYGQFNSIAKDNSLTVSQSFAFPTVYANQLKLAGSEVKSSGFLYQASALDIATQVKQAYWEYVYLLARQKLLVYQDSLFSGVSRAAELKTRVGEANRLEMISARSQSMEVKNQLFQIKSDIGICSRKLMLLMNTREVPMPADSLLNQVNAAAPAGNADLGQNPSLGWAREQVAAAGISRKLESSRMLPEFNLGYFSQTIMGTQEVNGVPKDFGLDFRFTGVQAGISVPLWFGPYAAKTKAARITELKACTDAENMNLTAAGTYKSLLEEYQKFSATVEYYEKQAVPEADLIIQQATLSYKSGALDYLDYVLTLNRALSIRQSYLEALFNFRQTKISIENITGQIF